MTYIRRADARRSRPAPSRTGPRIAAPLAAGMVARYLQRHARATPAEAARALTAAATRDAVGNAGQAPNLLLHVVN